MSNGIDVYYAEALVKSESPDPNFITTYEWIILQVDTQDVDIAKEKALQYMKEHYNHSYQGGVWIDVSFIRIVTMNPSIETEKRDVMEIYSCFFTDLQAFEKWREAFLNRPE